MGVERPHHDVPHGVESVQGEIIPCLMVFGIKCRPIVNAGDYVDHYHILPFEVPACQSLFNSFPCRSRRLIESTVLPREKNTASLEVFVLGTLWNFAIPLPFGEECRSIEPQFSPCSNRLCNGISDIRYSDVEHQEAPIFLEQKRSGCEFGTNPWTRHFQLSPGSFGGALGSIGGFFIGEQSDEVYDKQSEGNNNRSDFATLLPRWGVIFAPVGLVMLAWGWWNLRSERRVNLAEPTFWCGVIFWMYGFAFIVDWSAPF
jgi:hypothetical protein